MRELLVQLFRAVIYDVCVGVCFAIEVFIYMFLVCLFVANTNSNTS